MGQGLAGYFLVTGVSWELREKNGQKVGGGDEKTLTGKGPLKGSISPIGIWRRVEGGVHTPNEN